MPLFEAKEAKKARRDVAIRLAKKRVTSFISKCQGQGEKYRELARRAYSLGRDNQGDAYLYKCKNYLDKSDQWAAFQLRIEDIMLSGEMAGAIGSLTNGLKAMAKEMKDQVSIKDIQSTAVEINGAVVGLENAEEQIGQVMEGIHDGMGIEAPDLATAGIPNDEMEEIKRMRSQLMDDVILEERTGGEGGLPKVDQRIQNGLDRIKKLKKKTD